MSTKRSPPGRSPIREVIEGGKEIAPPAPPDAGLPDGSAGHGGGGAAGPRGRNPYLPDGCPVRPLGVEPGGVLVVCDSLGDERHIKPQELTRQTCISLYGQHQGLLLQHWGRRNRNGEITGFAPELMQAALTAACHREGPLDPTSIRGRGAFRGDAGDLIYHTGSAVWTGGAWRSPGKYEGYLYTAAPPIPAPWDKPCAPDELKPLKAILGSFSWKRPIDAELFLGQIAVLAIGGALPWRPIVWITGPRGAGKSSLHQLVAAVLGKGVIASADPSAAGLRQSMKAQTLPLLVDEMEAAEDNRRNQDILKLFRNAASGATATRGASTSRAMSSPASMRPIWRRSCAPRWRSPPPAPFIMYATTSRRRRRT